MDIIHEQSLYVDTVVARDTRKLHLLVSAIWTPITVVCMIGTFLIKDWTSVWLCAACLIVCVASAIFHADPNCKIHKDVEKVALYHEMGFCPVCAALERLRTPLPLMTSMEAAVEKYPQYFSGPPERVK